MLRKILELPITLLRMLSEWPARMGRNRRRKSGKEQSRRKVPGSSRRKGGVLASIGKVFTLPLDWIRSGSDSLARAGKTRERGKQKKQAKSSRGPSKATSTAKADRWLTNLGRKLIHPFILFSTWLERFGPKKPKVKHDPKAEKEALKDRVQQIEKKKARAEWWKNSWVGKTIRFIAPPFVFAWTLIKTRDPALLWWMLPLILIVGGLGFVVYQTTFVDARKIAVRYESAVAAAIKAGDLKSANLFQRKLEQLGISTERGIFKRAFALGESGDLEGAAEQMRTIAKPDAPGHAAAHYWLAQKLIDEELKGFPPPENAQLALQHIEQLKARIGMYPEVSFIEAVALAKLGRLDEASLAFGESPRQYLEAATAKMEIDLARGDEAAARQVAITVQRHLAQLRVEGKELTEVQYEQDLRSAELLDDAKAAALAVENWFKANPNSDEARLYSGALKLREFDKWLLNPKEDTLKEFAALIVEVSKSIPEERDDLVRRRLNSINRSRDDATVDQALRNAGSIARSDRELAGILCDCGCNQAAMGNG